MEKDEHGHETAGSFNVSRVCQHLLLLTPGSGEHIKDTQQQTARSCLKIGASSSARLCRLLHPPLQTLVSSQQRPSLTRMAALLQHTRLMASHVGRSSRLCRTSSSSSRLVSWPSPFSVLRLILSGDRFLANLREARGESTGFRPGGGFNVRSKEQFF